MRALPGVADVDVQMTAKVRSASAPETGRPPLPGVKNVIAVGAGKGGVGKTTVAVNLALALAKCGSRVGMLDGDIYGPNVPIMLGLNTQLTTDGKQIVPAEKYGVQVVSMGFLTAGRCADHLARADAARRHPAVLPRGRLEGSRLPDRRHAAGHRRRGAQPEPDRAGRRRDRRDDAAAGVAGRQPPRGPDVSEAEHPDDRHRREHELLRLHRTATTRPTSSATAAARRWRRRWTCRSSAGCRSISRSARAATPACRSSIAEPASPAARAFLTVAERTAAQVSIAAHKTAEANKGKIPLIPGSVSARRDRRIDLPFTKRTLANGLDVIVHEDHHVPIVAVNVWYHVGSKNERPGRTGFAHLFEHLMFEGSEHHNTGYFPPLQQAGALLNGSTNTDRTNYWEVVPTSAVDLALWMESDRMGYLLPALTPRAVRDAARRRAERAAAELREPAVRPGDDGDHARRCSRRTIRITG